MKLNIYDKKKVVKTYQTDEYNLMFGVLEDVAKAIKLDELKSGSDAEIIRLVGGTVLNSMDTVKGLMLDIFDGLTEDELRGASVREIAAVLVDVVKYTISTLTKYAPKN